jgi:hypothetical protein
MGRSLVSGGNVCRKFQPLKELPSGQSCYLKVVEGRLDLWPGTRPLREGRAVLFKLVIVFAFGFLFAHVLTSGAKLVDSFREYKEVANVPGRF